MGVFLLIFFSGKGAESLPHVRGGVSFLWYQGKYDSGSSPRAWGCFLIFRSGLSGRLVFPTCVGVFLGATPPRGATTSLPHVRGGVSKSEWGTADILVSSPRAWGCFYPLRSSFQRILVFPTCVGVFPYLYFTFPEAFRSSPRAWGCFSSSLPAPPLVEVFPTCVGVFLARVWIGTDVR